MASVRIACGLDKCGGDSTVGGVRLALHPEFLELPRQRRFLLGISGGCDSVALLHALLAQGYRDLVLCHLNHGMRGEESDQDAAFVQSLAKKHNLRCEAGQVDVLRLAEENGESMELAARNARHRFFSECGNVHHCNRVLLGHHADDHAETILFNLLRGSAGLKGMRVQSQVSCGDGTLEFFRPLLAVPRDEIDRYLSAQEIAYREDKTNAEAIATRNRLRHEVMPLLGEIMGRDIRPALVRAEEISRNQSQTIHELLDKQELEDPQGRLFLPKLKLLSTALRMAVLHRYLKKNGVPDIDAALLDRCQKLLNEPSVAKVNLPGDRWLRRKEKRIFVS